MRAPGQYAGTNNEKHACVSVSLVYVDEATFAWVRSRRRQRN